MRLRDYQEAAASRKALAEIAAICDGADTGGLDAIVAIYNIAKAALADATTEKSSAVGNAAAMRHALAIMYDWILKAGNVYGYPDTEQKRRQLYGMMTKDLSAPARNCDRFATVKDAAIAFARERQDAPHPCPDFTFSAWLFAPAAERKGDNDGK